METNCSVTLYNKYTDKTTLKECYKKTVINKANWQPTQTKTITNNVLQSADLINIFIPFINNFDNKAYINPKAWNKLLDIDRDNYFTFQATDRIVKGECDYEFMPTTNPITNLDKLDNVATIMSVITNDNGSKPMQHFQLGAK